MIDSDIPVTTREDRLVTLIYEMADALGIYDERAAAIFIEATHLILADKLTQRYETEH
jgi:hypothetical protein